ncbi:hypothetical protein [Rhizobium sp. RCAM05973]|uniref:hypothetical protein n=1 Tax=Rhizobium sp. RCAM05973 TaxID=2994066 RepID=UPI0022EC0857|nr:hypothetical protein [Rhizobium sp. RCAM05973]
MQKLEELIAALEKTEGPDRELDTQIWLLTTEGATRATRHIESSTNAWPPYDIDETRNANGAFVNPDKVTGSIDAAVALVERVLPGWVWGISALGDVLLYERDDSPAAYRTKIKLDHPVPAIALCLATLRSKLSQEKNNAE